MCTRDRWLASPFTVDGGALVSAVSCWVSGRQQTRRHHDSQRSYCNLETATAAVAGCKSGNFLNRIRNSKILPKQIPSVVAASASESYDLYCSFLSRA